MEASLKHALIFRTHGDAGNGAAPLIHANRITVEKIPANGTRFKRLTNTNVCFAFCMRIVPVGSAPLVAGSQTYGSGELT